MTLVNFYLMSFGRGLFVRVLIVQKREGKEKKGKTREKKKKEERERERERERRGKTSKVGNNESPKGRKKEDDSPLL